MNRLLTSYEAFLRWLFGRSALLSFIVLLLIGIMLVGASALIGVFSFELEVAPGRFKQVGYFWAPNWSFMMVLGFPVMFFFMLETADSLRYALERLATNRMLVDDSWQPVPLSALDDERARLWRFSAGASLLLLLFFSGYCLWEWFRVSGYPLLLNEPPIAPGTSDWIDELDWSVAAVLAGPGHGTVGFRLANGIFSLVNYLVVAFYLSIIFSYYTLLICYADLFRRLAKTANPDRIRMIPDVNETEPRRGFGLFQPAFRQVLLATLLGFMMCFFMNLQNAYLRNNDALTILQFAAPSLTAGGTLPADSASREGWTTLVGGLFKAPEVFNLTSAWALVGVFIFFSCVLLSLVWTLSNAAERGRTDLRDFIRADDQPIDQLTRLDRDEALQRLAEWSPEQRTGMVIWPFGWPRQRQLLIFLVFGAAATILYKLGLLFAGAVIIYVTTAMLRRPES